MALDIEDVVGITTGVVVGSVGLDLIASLVIGWDSSWLVFLVGAIVGAPIGYRYAESVWNWRRFWWRW